MTSLKPVSTPVAPRTTPTPRPASTATPEVATPTGWQARGATAPRGATPAQQVAPGSGNQEVMCPVLRALVNEGRVQLKADGTVSLDELDVAALPEGIVPHPADTQILRQGHFDAAKFDALVQHADRGVMTTDAFAKAIAANYRRDVNAGADRLDATTRGLNFAQVEFAGLLAVFGSRDNVTGKTGIKVEDLRVLYEQGTIPPGMLGQRSSVVEAVALQASLAVKSDANVARGALDSVFTARGLSSAGARLAGAEAGEVGVAGQVASMSAGKAAACPHLSGAAKMPSTPAAVVNAHTPAAKR